MTARVSGDFVAPAGVLLLLVFTGCFGESPVRDAGEPRPSAPDPGVTVHEASDGTTYSIVSSDVDARNNLTHRILRFHQDATVNVTIHGLFETWGGRDGCIAAGAWMSEPGVVEDAKARASRGESEATRLRSAALVAWFQGGYFGVQAGAGSVRVEEDPADRLGVPEESGGDLRPLEVTATWRAAAGERLVLTLGAGEHRLPEKPGAINVLTIDVRIDGDASIEAAESTDLRCGYGLRQVQGSTLHASSAFPAANAGGSLFLETTNGSSMYFENRLTQASGLHPQRGVLHFLNRTTSVQDDHVRFLDHGPEAGRIGFELEAWTDVAAGGNPIWMLADVGWRGFVVDYV